MALAVAVLSFDVAIVKATLPAVAEFAAISDAIDIENAAPAAIAQVVASTRVTVNASAVVFPVAVQVAGLLPLPLTIVTAKAVVCTVNTPVEVTVMVSAAAKAVVAVAPKVINVGVALTLRSFARNDALDIFFSARA